MHRATRTFSSPDRVTPLSTTARPSTAPPQDPHASPPCATVDPCNDAPDEIHHFDTHHSDAGGPAAFRPWGALAGGCGRGRAGLGGLGLRGSGRRGSDLRGPGLRASGFQGPGRRARYHREAGYQALDFPSHPRSRRLTPRAASSRPAPWKCCWPRPRPRYSPSWARASPLPSPPRWQVRRRSTGPRQWPGEAPATRPPATAPSPLPRTGPGLWRDRWGYDPRCCAAGILLRLPGRPGTAASTWAHPPVRRCGPQHLAGWRSRGRWPAAAS